MPDMDLLIRTSGEQRISGFMPYQAAYAELMFSEKLWPDFTPDDLTACIEDFGQRDRRLGK
jgi:undecaprenyl diphosphate synthase